MPKFYNTILCVVMCTVILMRFQCVLVYLMNTRACTNNKVGVSRDRKLVRR